MLMVQPNAQAVPKPVLSLLTDDWECPKRLWKAPNWLLGNVICVWLCSTDAADLFPVPALPPQGELSEATLSRSAEGRSMLSAMEGMF